MKKLYFLTFVLFASLTMSAQTPTYLNDFESGLGTGVSIQGSGELTTNATPGFGQVYHNNPASNLDPRTNYLKLPSNIIADAVAAGNYALSIGFWVNLGTGEDKRFEDDDTTVIANSNYYTNMFALYGGQGALFDNAGVMENTAPMFILESRGWCQTNMFAGNVQHGWTNFENTSNVAGKNNESPIDTGLIWLSDDEWHYYTMTMDSNTVITYRDGTVWNEWEFDGNKLGGSVSGIFVRGDTMTYPCLGGNQAWGWGDMDSEFLYDDFAVYSSMLTAAEIQAIIATKPTSGPSAISDNKLESIIHIYSNGGQLQFNNIASDASIQVYNLLGKTVSSGSEYEIEGQTFPAGVYIINIITGNVSVSQKVLVRN